MSGPAFPFKSRPSAALVLIADATALKTSRRCHCCCRHCYTLEAGGSCSNPELGFRGFLSNCPIGQWRWHLLMLVAMDIYACVTNFDLQNRAGTFLLYRAHLLLSENEHQSTSSGAQKVSWTQPQVIRSSFNVLFFASPFRYMDKTLQCKLKLLCVSDAASSNCVLSPILIQWSWMPIGL